MGLFGAIGNLVSGAVKIAVTPIAASIDVVTIATGNEADNTKKLLKSAGEDLAEAGDEITETF